MSDVKAVITWNRLQEVLERNNLEVIFAYDSDLQEWVFKIMSKDVIYVKTISLFQTKNIKEVEAWVSGYEQKSKEYTVGGKEY